MYLTAVPLAAFFAIALAQNEQNENPFKVPPGFALTAGKPTTLTWTPTTPGTITLRLREGSSNNLETVEIIQASIPNSGSYEYTPPADATRNSDYTIEIVSDDDPKATNYTPFFVLESTNTVPKQASSGTASSDTATASATSASSVSSDSSTTATSTDSASSSASRASKTTSKSSTASKSATATSTGSGSEAGSDNGPSVPSNGAVPGAITGLSAQGGLIVLLGAFAAW